MASDSPFVSPVLSLEAIELSVTLAEKRALFVEPRILRRVIVQDRRIPGLGLRVPHSRVYTIERERLLIIADRSELGLSPAAELPRRMILIGRPTDDEEFAQLSSEERLHAFWRLTFHGRVHAEVEQRIEDQQLTSPQIAEFIHQIGAGEFTEIRQVLAKDEWLLPPHDDEEAFVEFLAVALELQYFAPWDLELFFPAIRDWDCVRSLWANLPHEQWYRETQPAGTPERLVPAAAESPADEHAAPPVARPHSARKFSDSTRESLADPLLIRANRSQEIGNHVKAAILSMRAQSIAPAPAINQRASAEEFIFQLASRLQSVWMLTDEERDEWWRALCPLLTRASEGYRSLEARILYDLQKVCIAHERGVYRFNVGRWIWTLGQEPLRLQLPLLETVQSAKYLRSIADRSSSIRIAAAERQRLMSLIDRERERSDQHLRQTVRPLIEKTLNEVGLVPQNIPERVARRKVIEGLLDRLVERGFMTMGDLRDALSQSQLKLPDVSGPLELAWGDRLLRADRKLGTVLDGVYRPGAVYLRWSQRLSSLAFGTALGRFLVRNAVLPFGGAFLALAALLHLFPELFTESSPVAETAVTAPVEVAPGKPTSWREEPATKAEPTSETSGETSSTNTPAAITQPTGEANKDSTVEKIGDLAADALQGAKDVAESAATTVIKATLRDAPQKTLDNANNAKPLTPTFYVAWVVFGIFLWMILHRPKFRRSVVKFFIRLWTGIIWLLYDFPVSVFESPLVQRVLDSRAFGIFKSYLLRPTIMTFVIVGVVRAIFLSAITQYTWWESFRQLSLRGWFESFLLLNLFLNSPAGRSAEERVLDICVRAWHELRFRIFAVIYHVVMDLFHDVMQWIEQSLYTVDEWLRFRSGDRRRFVLVKILIGSIWSVVSYVIRFVITLLVEPQINPIKHFPVVTVSHKILLPYSFHLRDLIVTSTGVSQESANLIAGAIVFLSPGIAGFLVWELKENWQLYVANRPRKFGPVRVGSHGESVAALLRPGFRAGTLSKIFTKLRAALRLESDPGHGYRSTQKLAEIEHVSLAVRRFVERDFCNLIEEASLLPESTISVNHIHAATNRFDIELVRSSATDRPATIRWEDLEGWLVARIVEPGWIDDLPVAIQDRLNVALTGLYQLAGIDLVREQIVAATSQSSHGEPDLEFRRTAIQAVSTTGDWAIYPLQGERKQISPSTSESTEASQWPTVNRQEIVFQDADIPWTDWLSQWPDSTQPPPHLSCIPHVVSPVLEKS